MPLLRALVADDLKELIVLLLLPLGLRDGRFVTLVPLVLALGVIPPRDELRHILPVT